jgi:hypothetical protein
VPARHHELWITTRVDFLAARCKSQLPEIGGFPFIP